MKFSKSVSSLAILVLGLSWVCSSKAESPRVPSVPKVQETKIEAGQELMPAHSAALGQALAKGKLTLPTTFGKALGGNTSGGGNDEATLEGMLPKSIRQTVSLDFSFNLDHEWVGSALNKPIVAQRECFLLFKCDVIAEKMRLNVT